MADGLVPVPSHTVWAVYDCCCARRPSQSLTVRDQLIRSFNETSSYHTAKAPKRAYVRLSPEASQKLSLFFNPISLLLLAR